jgi:hypothetical protein
MRESQAEIRAIQAKLRSIQANSPSHSHRDSVQTSQPINQSPSHAARPAVRSVSPQNIPSNSVLSRPVVHPASLPSGATATQTVSSPVTQMVARSDSPGLQQSRSTLANAVSTATDCSSDKLSKQAIAASRDSAPSPISSGGFMPVPRSSSPSVQSVPVDLPPIADSPGFSAPYRVEQPPSSRGETEEGVDWEPIPPYVHRLTNRTERLHEKSVQCLQQLAQSAVNSPEGQLDQALQRLEAQAQQINQLAATQEAAILEFKAIADQLEQDWKALELFNAAQAGYEPTDLDKLSLCEYGNVSVPQVEKNREGVLVVSTRSVDVFKAEREAALTAQALRHRSSPYAKSQRSWAGQISQWILGASSSPARRNGGVAPNRPPGRPTKRKIRGFNRREAITLLVGAVLVRILLNFLIAAHPGLWFPAIAIMMTPGAIALYRSSVTPRSTLTWGYRFIVIMIGFWIGGRLFF